MSRSVSLAALLVLSTPFLAPAARAESDAEVYGSAVREGSRTNALELVIGLGPAQGLGSAVDRGPTFEPLGAGFEAAASWRINRRWSVGAYGTLGLFPAEPADGGFAWSTSVAAGVQANYHFDVRGKPWLGLGTGWRTYRLSDTGTTTRYQGLDVVRLQAGFSVPVTPNVSIDPMVSASLATFFAQKGPSTASYADLPSQRASVFLTFGALVRFDLLGAAPKPILLSSN